MPGIRLAALVRKLRRNDPPDLGGRTDADLLARFAANRDEAAFELLVWRHGAMVLAASRRVLGHTEDAEDAFQAAFLVLARKAGSVRQSVPAWLHRVAVRIALRLARKRRPASSLEVEPAARPVPDSSELGELRGLLDAEIDRLSEPCRRAFVLCYLEGLSNADAARLIGCPVGTIESRLTSARKKLRTRLTHRKIELPAGALALLGAQSGLAKDVVAIVVRAGVAVAERGIRAAVGIVREPAAKLAQGVLVMTKIRATAAVSLGVALLGLAAGVGWASIASDPPLAVPEVVAAEAPEEAPQPRAKDGKGGEAWPLARQVSGDSGRLLRVAPDGKSLLMESGNRVFTSSLVGSSKSTINVYGENTLESVAVSPDGKYVLTAEGVNGVKFRDAKTGKILEGLWPRGELPAEQVAFSADGSKFVVLCSRTQEGRGFAGKMTAAERAKMGRLVARQYRMSVWDVVTRKEISESPQTLTGASATSGFITLAGQGHFILTAEVLLEGEEGKETFKARRYTILDPFAGRRKATVEIPEAAFGPFQPDPVSPDGGTLVLSDSSTRTDLRFIDTATGKDRFRIPPFRRPVKSVAFSGDGKLVAVGTGTAGSLSPKGGDSIAAPSEVAIWDATTGKELARFVDDDRIRNHSVVAFSPDGAFLVSQSSVGFGGGGGWGGTGGLLSIWGKLPPQEPQPEVVKPAPKKVAPPADVPERFQTLFGSLAGEGTTDAKRVESLFLAALGRLPSDVESRTLVSQLAKRSDKAEALKDLLGTLVETGEFKAHAEALGRLAK